MGNKKTSFEKFKRFFEMDMRIKETLLRIAPNEYDDFNEESRIEYTDKLYKELRNLEFEFIEMVRNFGNNPEMIQKIRDHFSKARDVFLIEKYNPGVIQQLYIRQFTGMNPKLIEDVKEEFWGYKLDGGNLEGCIEKSESINELLHVFHSYLTNNDKIMQNFPVIATKINEIEEPITLYGEETELSRKLFEEFPLELDCGCTDIVSMENKILMMIRDRGHALTIDIDTTKEDDILVKYFVPKLCNRQMIEALPGINTSSISANGATGLFQVSKEEMIQKLFEFIDKVPTDADIPRIYYVPNERQIFQEELRQGVPEINHNVLNEQNSKEVDEFIEQK